MGNKALRSIASVSPYWALTLAIGACVNAEQPANPPDAFKKAEVEKNAGESSSEPEQENASDEFLEPTLKRKAKRCENKGNYFDFSSSTCTERKLAEFPCDLKEILSPDSTTFSNAQKKEIRDYFLLNLKGYVLRSCVDDGNSYSFVTLMWEEKKAALKVQILEIAKAT